jgi:DNA-binding CsgD family transcriptional regulator
VNDIGDQTKAGVIPVGRDRELDDLAQLLDGALAGRGGALVVQGETGLGRTMLLNQAKQLASARDLQILTATGVPSESNLPFATLGQLLRPLLSSLSDIDGELTSHLRAALGLAKSLTVNPFYVAQATLDLLEAMASHRPILVIADDTHWMDRPSTQVLAFVGRRVEGEPVALVAAVNQRIADPFARSGLPATVLHPLSRVESAALLDQVSPDLPSDLRRLVLDNAAGNPLALSQLPSSAHRPEMVPGLLPVSGLLEKSLGGGAVRLPGPTRALLLLAAADSGPVALTELRQAAGQAAATDLQPAMDAGLVSLVRQRVVFRLPAMASAIYQSANFAERLRAHTALADVVEDEDRRIWHRAAATIGPDDELSGDLEKLAERSVRSGAPHFAVIALERAATLTPDRAHAADLLAKASEQALIIGRSRLARELLDRTDQERLSPVGRARLLAVEDGLGLADDDRLDVRALVGTALAAHQAGDQDVAAAVLWICAQRCYRTAGPLPDRLAISEATHALTLNPADPRRLAILAYAGLPGELGSLEQGHRLRDPPVTAEDLGHLGSADAALGRYRYAAQTLGATAPADCDDQQVGGPRLRTIQAWALLWSGPMDAAAQVASEAAGLSRPGCQAASLVIQSLVTGLRGDYLRARSEVDAGQINSEVVRAMAGYGLGIAALGVGHYDDAYRHLRQIVDPADPSFHYAARQWVAGDLVEAAVGAGRLTECAGLLADLDREWHLGPTAAVRWKLAYARAFLAEGDEAPERFEALLRTGPEGNELARGRATLNYGARLRRLRRTREAREVLRSARDTFTRLGVLGFAQRADDELRAAGGPDTRRHGSGLSGLTAQELQVARLAAEGLSNRQIAQQLQLSPRTVGSHLYRVFPKLGVTARRELEQALPQ